MSENSKIQWTDDTYNPWRGCTKVSAGCKNCYAEKLITTRLAHVHYDAATSGSAKRTSKQFHATDGGHSASGIQFWGKGSPRIRAVDLDEPLRWNKKPWVCDKCGYSYEKRGIGLGKECLAVDGKRLAKVGETPCQCKSFHRRRVFSLSLGDWLDDEVPIEWLADFLDVVRRCENLDWLLVTKRPELFDKRIFAVMLHAEKADPKDEQPYRPGTFCRWLEDWKVGNAAPKHVMVITSVENQKAADERIPELLQIPAARRGLSCEPLLGPVDLRGKDAQGSALDAYENDPKIDWVIAGGESGPDSRPCDVEWLRGIKDQCKAAGVPCFVKQLGANSTTHVATVPDRAEWRQTKPVHGQTGLLDKKGGDITEWPKDLQVREFYK